MDLEFESYVLTIDANNINVPDFSDDNLYNFVKEHLVHLLQSKDLKIIHFGYAPDNTADNNDELLNDGVFYRIIAQDRYLGIDLDADIKSEKTIELLYKEL